MVRAFYQPVYALTIGRGGTGLRRRGSRLDEGQPAFDDAVFGTTRSGRCGQVRFCRRLR